MQNSLVIELDDNKKGGSFLWSLVGTPEEQAELAEKRKYENNPLVITIKKLVETHTNGWSGSSTELINAMYDVTGKTPCTTARQIGKELGYLTNKLYRDGIEHKSGRSSSKREHSFTLRKEPSWLRYAPSYQSRMPIESEDK